MIFKMSGSKQKSKIWGPKLQLSLLLIGCVNL